MVRLRPFIACVLPVPEETTLRAPDIWVFTKVSPMLLAPPRAPPRNPAIKFAVDPVAVIWIVALISKPRQSPTDTLLPEVIAGLTVKNAPTKLGELLVIELPPVIWQSKAR